ncbi:hypothetical protein ACVBEQ_27950 [Nakamurella sp. GG22]
MSGELSMPRDAIDWPVGSKDCFGYQGYSDIKEGTSVTVYDGDEILAVGNLEAGVLGDGDVCTFLFAVSEVPLGRKFYQYEISHRGRLTVPSGDVQNLQSSELGN